MLGLPMRQALAGAVQVYDFAGRDLALPFPWNFVGGGNRQRRRIYGAVGPVRTNVSYVMHGQSRNPVVYDTNAAMTTVSATHFDGVVGDCKQFVGNDVYIRLGDFSGTGKMCMASIYARSVGGTNTCQFDYADTHPNGHGTVVVGEQWVRLADGRANLANPTYHFFDIIKFGVVPLQLCCFLLEDDTYQLSPWFDGPTTTNWQRTNKNYNFSDASSLAGCGPFGEPAAVLSIVDDRKELEAAGLAHLCSEGRKAFKYDNSAGTSHAWCSIAGSQDGSAHTASMFARGHGGGVFLRTGFNSGTDSYRVLSPHYERHIYRQSTINSGVLTSGDSVHLHLDPGAVLYFVLNQWEEGDDATAVIPVRGAAVTVNTPPFGEIVTVPAGQPRFDYGPDGIGRGFVAERGSRNLFSRDGFLVDVDSSGTVTAIPGYRDENGGNTAFGIRADSSASAIIRNRITATTTEITLQYMLRKGTHHNYGTDFGLYNITTAQDIAYASINYDTGALTTNGPSVGSMTATAVSAGVRGDFWLLTMKYSAGFVPGNVLNIYLGYVGNAGVPVGATHVISWVNAEPGLFPTSHIKPETAGVVPVADAESLETFDLQALDLHSGSGTILVDFIMPEIVSGNSHGIMSCANANGSEWMGVYTSTTDVAVSCYSGGTRYQFAQGGFSAGDRVRAALTFDTGYFASAVNGVPGPVTYGNNPIAYDRVITGDLVGPRSYPADTTISRAVTTGRVMFLDELVGKTAL